MEKITNKQLADRLVSFVEELRHNGDCIASQDLVRSIEHLLTFRFQGDEFVLRRDNATEMSGKQLSDCVKCVMNEARSGSPWSETLRQAVEKRDRNLLVSEFVFDGVWDGSCGWTNPQVLWDAVVYVWKNCPEFFDQYDTDRAIVDDRTQWTQDYLLWKQRNYLRNNFCLERLCHLVMVYEFLHGKDVCQPYVEVKPKTASMQPHHQIFNSQGASRKERSFAFGLITIAPVLLIVALGAYWLGGANRGRENCSEATPAETIDVSADNEPARDAEVINTEVENVNDSVVSSVKVDDNVETTNEDEKEAHTNVAEGVTILQPIDSGARKHTSIKQLKTK